MNFMHFNMITINASDIQMGRKKKKKNQTARVGIIRHTNQDRFEDSWEITKDRMTQSV